jgi:hypothetical protein
VCNEFPHSNYVFSGKVLSTSFRRDQYLEGVPSNEYRIRVDHTFKGRVPHIVSIYSPADSGGGGLIVGARAIVFATRTKGLIVFSGSSNTLSGKGVPRVISDIQRYLANPPQVATISGRVYSWVTGTMKPLGGARLQLSSRNAREFARADSHGNFIASVTPGRWSVRIAQPGWASSTGTYTYDSADGMLLAKGGCADVELDTSAPGEKLYGPGWKRWPK